MRILVLLLLVYSCASNKYEVVQEIGPGMYHTEEIKKKGIILYKTEMKLNPGDIVIIPNKIKKQNANN